MNDALRVVLEIIKAAGAISTLMKFALALRKRRNEYKQKMDDSIKN